MTHIEGSVELLIEKWSKNYEYVLCESLNKYKNLLNINKDTLEKYQLNEYLKQKIKDIDIDIDIINIKKNNPNQIGGSQKYTRNTKKPKIRKTKKLKIEN